MVLLRRSLPLFLILSLLFSCFSSQSYKTCERVIDTKKQRVLILAVDGLRGDVLEGELPKLPNIRRLINNGNYQPCNDIYNGDCARTVTGNRYVPFPLTAEGVGATEYIYKTPAGGLDSPLQQNYFWFTMPGWSAAFSGQDIPLTKTNNNSHIAGIKWSQSVPKTGGSLFLQAKNEGYKTAFAAVPAILTAAWLDVSLVPPPPITPGFLDYECGYGDQYSDVLPDDTSSCNLDYRLTTSEEDYDTNEIYDNFTFDFGKTMVDRGCAHVIGMHINYPDFTMHRYGMATAEYNQSLVYLDYIAGQMLDAIEKDVEKYNNNWLVALTADHGGARNEEATSITIRIPPIKALLPHSQNFFFDEAIPYIVSGFGAVDLAPLSRTPRNFDLCPTALAHLGIRWEESGEYYGMVNGVPEVQDEIGDKDVNPFADPDDDDDNSAGETRGVGWGLVFSLFLLRWWWL